VTSHEIHINRIVNAVIDALTKRQDSVYKTDVNALAAGLSTSVYSNHDTLLITLPDIPFIQQLANCHTNNPPGPAVQHVHNALSYGLDIQLSVHENLLPFLPVEGLAALPIQFIDQLGHQIKLEAGPLLSHQKVRTFLGKWLIISRTTLITSLANDILLQNNIHLIRVR